jgi:hypothetical protein
MGSNIDGVADICFFLLTSPDCLDERRDLLTEGGGGGAHLTFLWEDIFFFQ